MGVKIFGGLGIFSSPSSATGQSSQSSVTVPAVGNANIVVDQTQAGWLGAKVPTLPSSVSQPVSAPLSTLGSKAGLQVNSPAVLQQPQVVSLVNPQILSDESQISPFETMFHEFNMEARSFYNFWTADERSNDRDSLGNRHLSDVPRFIKLDWDMAPDLPNPDLSVTPHTQLVRPLVPVKFSAQVEAGRSFIERGIIFSPDHLQPVNFSQACKSLSNGYIEPGNVSSVVELSLNNSVGGDASSHAQIESVTRIDEDAFLAHPDTEGVSIHELQAQMNQLTNGIVGATRIAGAGVSPVASQDRDNLVDGKFIFSQPTQAGGLFQIHGVHSSSPALSMVVRTSTPGSEPLQSDEAIDLANKVTQPQNSYSTDQVANARVKFIDPSIGGVVDESKTNLMSRPEHAEMMMAVAHVLPNLEVLSQVGFQKLMKKIDIPSFNAPKGLKPLEYVGYIIEKYARDGSGAFIKVDEFQLADRTYTEYIDTKVLYGVSYRYRIRAVLRWTRPSNVGPLGVDPQVIPQNGSQASQLSPFRSSYFGSEWSAPWSYALLMDTQPPAPPSELIVRPESGKKRISVAFKLPWNPQKDIYKMRLMRKLQDEDGNDLTGWTQLNEYGSVDRKIDFGPQNVLYFDTNVEYYQVAKTRYVYAAQSVSRHEEDSTLSEQLGATLNRDYSVFGEHPVRFVSSPGVKLEHFGSFAVRPHRRTKSETIFNPRTGVQNVRVSFTIAGREKTGNVLMNQSQYLIRVESLDSGQQRFLNLSTTFNRLPEKVSSIPWVGFVPLVPAVQKSKPAPTWTTTPVNGQLGQSGDPQTKFRRPPRGTRGK